MLYSSNDVVKIKWDYIYNTIGLCIGRKFNISLFVFLATSKYHYSHQGQSINYLEVMTKFVVNFLGVGMPPVGTIPVVAHGLVLAILRKYEYGGSELNLIYARPVFSLLS